MRRRRPLAALLLSLLVLAAAPPATGAPGPVTWTLDEVGTRTMRDVGGAHVGRLPAGVAQGVPGVVGTAYRFDGRGAVVVPDAAALDAGDHTWAWSARVRVAPADAPLDMNVVQKGMIGSYGGQYKLELSSGGAPGCYARETRAAGAGGQSVEMRSRATVADGSWHQLTCRLTATSLQLTVDGRLVGQKPAGHIGAIAGSNPLTVGGKERCTELGCDYFRGSMDDVRVGSS